MKTLKILLIILAVLFIILFLFQCVLLFTSVNKEKEQLEIANNIINNTRENEIPVVTKEELEFNKNVIGILEIPAINLVAPIQEGTDEEILKVAIGHFSESSFWDGNVAFASHNRSQYVQYFENIHKLKAGDEIIYKTKLGTKTYEVYESTVIEATDWSVIENTSENIVTLITCIKDNPDSRLCVKAKEI